MFVTFSLDQIDFTCSMTTKPFFFSSRVGVLPSLLSEIGIEFNTVDEAWMFWIRYGGQKGFEVRKSTQTKENLMGRLPPADMFVQMRVGERKIKGII